ncbi:hypothetical protein C8J57DRAFT_1711655 [Mycena rebaudengoi]|nr:hypothetical protein C8J57DRAFT_1711655 [Mycena rebaudengoi]
MGHTASSLVDVPHPSYGTSSRPSSANSLPSRHSAKLGASGLSSSTGAPPTSFASAPHWGARLRRGWPRGQEYGGSGIERKCARILALNPVGPPSPTSNIAAGVPHSPTAATANTGELIESPPT